MQNNLERPPLQTPSFPGLSNPSHLQARRPRRRRIPDLRRSEQPSRPKPGEQRRGQVLAHPGQRQEGQRRQRGENPDADGAEERRQTIQGRREQTRREIVQSGRRKQTRREIVQSGIQRHAAQEINKLLQTSLVSDFFLRLTA